MRLRSPHRWTLDPAKARALQESLRRRLRFTPLEGVPRLVAAADCAVDAERKKIVGAVIVYSLPGLEEVERAWAVAPLRFPYVPGLLAFREAPATIEAFRRLKRSPDAALIDAHGLAHPRRMGEACLIGLWLGIPTAGAAKSVLVGEFEPPAAKAGSWTPLVHKGERVGAAFRAGEGLKPIFISPGNLIDLAGALRLARLVCDGYRIPKPLREADRWARELRAAL